jgi:hypothetical protein
MIYLRCIRFNTNQERNLVRDSIKIGAKNLSVLEIGAPDSVRCAPDTCTRPAALRTGNSWKFWGVLRYNSPDCPLCHRTVRWASGATIPCLPTVDCAELQCATASRQKSERKSQRAPDCPVQLEDKRLQRSTAPNPNDCADVVRTGQCTVAVRWRTELSGAPIASSLHQRLGSGWGL